MNLRALFLSLPLALSFPLAAGCGGGGADADAAKFEAIADETCKCTTADCVMKAKEKWDKLEQEMEKKYEGKKEDDPELKKALARAEAAESKAKECGKRIAGGGGGDEPPDSN